MAFMAFAFFFLGFCQYKMEVVGDESDRLSRISSESLTSDEEELEDGFEIGL